MYTPVRILVISIDTALKRYVLYSAHFAATLPFLRIFYDYRLYEFTIAIFRSTLNRCLVWEILVRRWSSVYSRIFFTFLFKKSEQKAIDLFALHVPFEISIFVFFLVNVQIFMYIIHLLLIYFFLNVYIFKFQITSNLMFYVYISHSRFLFMFILSLWNYVKKTFCRTMYNKMTM